MRNFIYSDILELSIVEYRLKNIFDILEKNNLVLYSPSLIFNETFWRLPFQEREDILKDLRLEWVGFSPKYSNIFSINKEDIEIIRALKTIYFNYTKITHDDLVNLLTSNKKNQITEFRTFGDDKNTTTLINNLRIRDINFDYTSTYTNTLIGEILFFKLTQKKVKNIRTLAMSYFPSLELWNQFFHKLLKKSNQNLEFELNLIITSKNSLNYVKNKIKRYKFLFKANKLGILKITHLEINNLSELDKTEKKYNFIIFENLLSLLPSDFIQKYENEYYIRLMRFLGNQKLPKEEIENIKILLEDQENNKIDIKNLLEKVNIDLIWSKYENTEITDYLTRNKLVDEYLTTTLPLKSIELTSQVMENLDKRGTIFIIDYFDKFGLNFATQYDLNQFEKTPVNLKIYKHILESLYGVKISFTNIKDFILQKETTEDIKNQIDTSINIESFLKLIINNKEIARKFFEFDLFEFNKYLDEIEEKYKYFVIFRKKKIFLFGLGSFLYMMGFKKYMSEVESILKYYDPNINIKELKLKWFDSYKKEVLFEVFPYVIAMMKKESEMPIIFSNSKKNKYLKKMLKKLKIDFGKFILFITTHKDLIQEIRKNEMNEMIEYGVITLQYLIN